MEEIYEFSEGLRGFLPSPPVTTGSRVCARFGTVNIYNGRLFIQTGKLKSVSRQLHKNPKLEICAMKDGKWMRVEATAAEDDDREARVSMLAAYPEPESALLSGRRQHPEVWFLRNVTATLYSFTEPPVVYHC